jgi:3-hydroxybutyryl-CoA dehydrogenase
MADDVRLGVVGGGLMGSGIAEVAARAGVDVIVAEVDQGACEAARSRIERSMDRAVERGKASAEERDRALGHLRFSADLDDLADRTHVIEAIVEDEDAKTELFGHLDRVVDAADAVLGTNTSSIPVTRLATATSRPGAVIGIHFFNPVPVLPLVELVATELTDTGTRERARALAEEVLGKQAIWCPDRAGFVATLLSVLSLLSALPPPEAGVASPEDIDAGMVLGCNHPIGPLALTDLVGLDTALAVAETLYEEFRDATFAPPVLLRRKVEAGLLGRKTGRGFYEYDRR